MNTGRLGCHASLHPWICIPSIQSPSRKYHHSNYHSPHLTFPQQKRLFHVITAFITLFATISYFAMATGDGNTFAKIVVNDSTKEILYRQVFWARYVDWTLTTPLLLLDLAFLAGLSGANILVAIVADMVMVLLGLFAAFGKTDGQKWGYYAMACAAMLVIFYQLVVPGRESVRAKDGSTAKLFKIGRAHV